MQAHISCHQLIMIVLLTLVCRINGYTQTPAYLAYHRQVSEAEELIGNREYEAALYRYQQLFVNYNFIFLHEYQMATQLALLLDQKDSALQYLKAGIRAGWSWKSIRKNDFIRDHLDQPELKRLKQDFRLLHEQYESHIDQSVKKEVHNMFSRDQWLAFGALFTFSSKRQDRYAEHKFAPQSDRSVHRLGELMDSIGYPGEQLIGNNIWAYTILSHHNSISRQYVLQDTLYRELQPGLMEALQEGEISPFEFAMIDEWYRAVKSDRTLTGYGYLNPPRAATLQETNALRKAAGLRSVEVRNRLVDVGRDTGMDPYLPGSGWVKGKIEVK